MGTDFIAPHGTPVFAPCDGLAFYLTDSHGGDGIYVRPTETFEYKNWDAYANVIHWHLCSKDDPQYKPLIPTDGSQVPVKRGQLIGYSDNSGAPFESSGDHLHWGLLPTDVQGNPIEPDNGFGGCIDPMGYCNNFFAGDAPAVIQNLETQISLLQKVVNLLKQLFK
jgi:murein DD-endopeptidase MepM/ murein hydrolase activator NlpD